MKELKDYLMYYIGCDAIIDGNKGKIRGFKYGTSGRLLVLNTCLTGMGHFTVVDNIKPILRRVESMTDAEAKELGYGYAAAFIDDDHEFGTHSPNNMHYLLKQGFDMFELIESNLAIDAATLTQTHDLHIPPPHIKP